MPDLGLWLQPNKHSAGSVHRTQYETGNGASPRHAAGRCQISRCHKNCGANEAPCGRQIASGVARLHSRTSFRNATLITVYPVFLAGLVDFGRFQTL